MLNTRWRAAAPFLLTGGAAIIAGGLMAALVAHQPVRSLVWMSSYLVLVVGVAQILFAVGQAALSEHAPGKARVAVEWLLLNLGNLLVIGGTLMGGWLPMVTAGTVIFVATIALFLVSVRGTQWRTWRAAYRIVLILIGASALVGLALTLHPPPH